MTTIRPHLSYLTQPAPGVQLLNVQLAPGEVWPVDGFVRLELTQAQLANILVDGAAMAFRTAGVVG